MKNKSNDSSSLMNANIGAASEGLLRSASIPALVSLFITNSPVVTGAVMPPENAAFALEVLGQL